jgi:hypothetical protein
MDITMRMTIRLQCRPLTRDVGSEICYLEGAIEPAVGQGGLDLNRLSF